MRNFCSDFLRSIQGLVAFVILRPFCVDRSSCRHFRLIDYGFHEAFENNPQIIYKKGVFRGVKIEHKIVINSCKWIKQFVERRLWRGRWQQIVLHLIGVSEPLCSSLHLLLRPTTTCGYNDQKDYDISLSAVKLERKIAVYSVLTGHYDSIMDPLYVTPGVDYILFTNCEVKTNVWKIIKVDNNGLSDLLLSRRIKMLPWEYLPQGYGYSVYVDANVIIWGDITMLTTFLSDKISLAVTAHSVRNSVWDEFMELVSLSKVDFELVKDVYDAYVDDGFQDEIGLAECTVLVRNHNDDKLRSLMILWWREFCTRGLYRDQPSLMYCLWKTHFEEHYAMLDAHVMNNQFCTVHSHFVRT